MSTITALEKVITVDGIRYVLDIDRISKEVEIQDVDHNILWSAIEDYTGEYIGFFDHNDEHITTSPHIGNFEGIQDCIEWFIGSRA